MPRQTCGSMESYYCRSWNCVTSCDGPREWDVGNRFGSPECGAIPRAKYLRYGCNLTKLHYLCKAKGFPPYKPL